MPEATDGPEKWVPEAIAQQEEYLKRMRSCEDVIGRQHAYRDFGQPSTDGSITGATLWRECIVCGVTETDEDYHKRGNRR